MKDLNNVIALFCVFMVFASSIGVIYVAHLNRQHFANLQNLHAEQDLLEHEYEKLLLEKSAWSDLNRIEQISKSRLAMKEPVLREIVMVNK